MGRKRAAGSGSYRTKRQAHSGTVFFAGNTGERRERIFCGPLFLVFLMIAGRRVFVNGAAEKAQIGGEIFIKN